MIPFSKGLYLLEALYSFFVYDSITNKYISLVTKFNRRENCILGYPRKINELSFVKLDSSITFIYNINDLSNCMEIECDNFSLTRFLNHPKFLITTKSFSIIQYENNNDQYVTIKELGEIKKEIQKPFQFSLLLNNNLLFIFDEFSKDYLLLDFKKEFSYHICNSQIDNNGRLLKLDSPVFKQLRQYIQFSELEPTYNIYALNRKKTEFFVTNGCHLIIFNKIKILHILPFKHSDVRGFKIGKFKYFFTIEKILKDYNDFVYIFNSKTKSLKCLNNEKIQGNSFYYNNKLSYITISIDEIKIIDFETGKIVKQIKAENQGNLISAIVCPKNRILAASQNTKLCLWDIETGKLLFFKEVRSSLTYDWADMYITKNEVVVIDFINYIRSINSMLDLNNLEKDICDDNSGVNDFLKQKFIIKLKRIMKMVFSKNYYIIKRQAQIYKIFMN